MLIDIHGAVIQQCGRRRRRSGCQQPIQECLLGKSQRRCRTAYHCCELERVSVLAVFSCACIQLFKAEHDQQALFSSCIHYMPAGGIHCITHALPLKQPQIDNHRQANRLPYPFHNMA